MGLKNFFLKNNKKSFKFGKKFLIKILKKNKLKQLSTQLYYAFYDLMF